MSRAKISSKGQITIPKSLRDELVEEHHALIYGAFDVKFNHTIALADAFTVATFRKLQGKIIAADSDFLPFDNVIWVGNPQIFKEFQHKISEGKEAD